MIHIFHLKSGGGWYQFSERKMDMVSYFKINSYSIFLMREICNSLPEMCNIYHSAPNYICRITNTYKNEKVKNGITCSVKFSIYF
jgi:hypothetical protein